ncbi:MAG: sugar ABC transporter ATP-binding protein [Acidobacteriia bacterium]|nr:sugar ABC transporter ATP-binding protein [Methyloceanibacter sp.]MCL6490649.1 sugar ABC transporter ATP-binding protein [Terriglobia bacterium]
MTGIEKRFGGVVALRGVDFRLHAGEIHGLAGENGAGKSTLMKIIAGVHTDYSGRMELEGRPVRFRSARDALAAGIGMVHQELSIVPELTVAENVLLGAQPTNKLGFVDWRRMMTEAGEHLQSLGISVDVRAPIGALPLGLQQMIEIARVIFSGARIIILDEPTSALSPPEIERLFELLRQLRAQGRSMIFISHFLDDILRICDAVTVFRNGQKVASSAAAIDKMWIIDHMIGAGHQELEESYLGEFQLKSRTEAPVVLEAEDLCLRGAFEDVGLRVHAGEVLGLYGFMGSGQLELTRSLFGKLPPERGRVRIMGKEVRITSTAVAKRAGLAFLPESRRSMLFALEPVYRNISISILERLSRLWVKPATERALAHEQVSALRIRPPNVDLPVGTLSGGNQQKVALARWLTHLPHVLLLNEPTRGMDVGAKEDVVRIVRDLSARGVGVLVASTEPETVLALADRILVMKKGRIVHEFAGEAVSKDRLLAAA